MSAQALVKDVKKLVDAMTSDRDALTEAAQMIAKTVSRLSEEVKEAASALTSENQTGQVRYHNIMYYCSIIFLFDRFLF